MTGLKTFYVTLWEHSLFQTTIRAPSKEAALEAAQRRYVSPGAFDGFDILDNYDDGWEVRHRPKSSRKR
jgi:hypothetical protein